MKKYRATSMQNGGKTPVKPPVQKKYTDATGTYTLGVNGQKSYLVERKPAAAKPAAKAAAPKKPAPHMIYKTEGEQVGDMLKKGDYMGVAKSFGDAITGVPRELYGALKRTNPFRERSYYQGGGKMKVATKSYAAPKGRK